MKLRNKKTGEIKTAYVQVIVENNHPAKPLKYDTQLSLAELNEKWEDYKEPKGMRWVDVSGANDGRVIIQYSNDEEAEKAVEKLKAWKRLKDKGFRFERWTIDDGFKISIRTNLKGDNIYNESEKEIRESLDLLFRRRENEQG